jgi:hypothetical protein
MIAAAFIQPSGSAATARAIPGFADGVVRALRETIESDRARLCGILEANKRGDRGEVERIVQDWLKEVGKQCLLLQ